MCLVSVAGGWAHAQMYARVSAHGLTLVSCLLLVICHQVPCALRQLLECLV